ncbi:MAG: hypothetical protein OEX19_08700 [Gammaproteobacteria bacterium]|nr:hypothetical protein [Gammaproteobacteria bacterium]
MNKCVVAAALVLGLGIYGMAKADAASEDSIITEGVYLRPFIGSGYSFFNNSPSQTYERGVADGINRTNIEAAFGIQVLSDITPRLRLGVEAGFIHWVNETTDNDNHPLSTTGDEYCYHTINTLALMELKISERFFIQAGSGLATSVKPFNKYTGATPYFMIAPGMNLQISKDTTIPLLIRLSTLETGKGDFGTGNGFGSIIPVTVMAGVTLSF